MLFSLLMLQSYGIPPNLFAQIQLNNATEMNVCVEHRMARYL